MDITDLRVLATVLAAIAMVAVAIWAFGPSRRQYFRDAAELPFADENEAADEQNGQPDQSRDSGAQKASGDRE